MDLPRKKKQKMTMACTTGGSHHDLISVLSDDLLRSIISLLPAKAAVATAILSRRWSHLWKSVYRLDFDPPNVEEEEDLDDPIDLIPLGIIQHVLTSSSHRNNVTVCRISHYPQDWRFRPLRELMNHLKVGKAIEELALTRIDDRDVSGRWYFDATLPASVFRCQTLRVLELNKYRISFPDSIDAAFEGCVNLTTLKLNSVHLSSQSLSTIISNCELLENLSLCSCYGLKYPNISDHKLKFLELRDLEFVLWRVDPVEFWEKSYINCPNLRVFQVYCSRIIPNSDILQRCCGLVRSSTEHGGDYRSLADLRVLCTGLDLNDMTDNILLSFIFRTSLHLQKIDITNWVNYRGPTCRSNLYPLSHPESMFWERAELSDSITYHLRVVLIRGFTGKEREMRLASHLIKNATMLEKIEIQCDFQCSRQGAVATMGLRSLPRASMNDPVILKSPGVMTFENWVSTLPP